MVKSKTSFIGSIATVGALAGIGVFGGVMPASAATAGTDPAKNSQGQCLVTPSKWNTVNHAEVSRLVDKVTPGKEAVTHQESRWSRTVPGVDAVTHEETKYFRDIPGKAEVSHMEYRFSQLIKGLEEISHEERQFQRENPGQAEVSHKEYQFSRTNPGQQGKTYPEYKYSKQVPPVVETKYKKADVKTEYQYQKSVKGVIQKWNGHKWVNTSDNFGWELYSETSTQWSSQNRDVLQSGPHNAIQGNPWTERGVQYRKVSTHYQYVKNGVTRTVPTGSYTYGWFTSNPGAPWVSTGITQVKTPATTIHYNNGNWTTDVNPEGYTKVAEREVPDPNHPYVAPFKEYRAQDGSATTNPANAGWFPKGTAPGWQQEGQPKKVVDQAYIAPFTEYRMADGTPTTDVTKAAWFREASFPGWQQYGEPEVIVDRPATDDETRYLTRDAQGNLGSSTNEADASLIPDSAVDTIDTTVWKQYGAPKKVVDQAAVPDKRAHLTQDAEGVLGESDDAEDASWFRTDDTDVNLAIWQQMVDKHGDPLIRVVEDEAAIPGYPEYYVPGGQPTRDLGESNWTPEGEEPEGWTFVDDREVTDEAAVPPVITKVKVVDKEAWTERKLVPATYQDCVLPTTGSDTDWGPAGLAGLGALTLGAALVGGTMIRRRHLRQAEEALNS